MRLRPRATGLAAVVTLFCCSAAARAGEALEPPSVVAELDRLWGERAHSAAVDSAVALGTRAAEQHPSSYDITWRLARAYWRKGDLATENAQRQALYGAARRQAQLASTLAPQRVEGHCYYGLTTGDYGGTLSVVRAVLERIASTFEREITRAYEIDRDFDNGAPMLALGRYYFKLPWPKRDLAASRRYLEELRQRHPSVLLGRVYLAETDYALGDDAAARRELEYVLSHDPLPDRGVEEGDIKSDAQQQLQQWFGRTATPG